MGFFVVRRVYKFLSWASSPSHLSCSPLAFGFIGWTRVSHGCWANGLSLSCRRRGRWCYSTKKKRKEKNRTRKPRAPSHIWTDEETDVFLSLMQGDETTIGYFNRMNLKRCRGRRPWRKSPGSWEQRAPAWQQSNSTATVPSPFFTVVIRDGWLVSFDWAIVIHFIYSMLKLQFIILKN